MIIFTATATQMKILGFTVNFFIGFLLLSGFFVARSLAFFSNARVSLPFHTSSIKSRTQVLKCPCLNSNNGHSPFFKYQMRDETLPRTKQRMNDFRTTRRRRCRLSLSNSDLDYMQLAISHAQKGLGFTFPNPAVGCVLVSKQEDKEVVVGEGFHPAAGYPHAEVFALLQAAGHVSSGVTAAQSMLPNGSDNADLKNKVKKLSEIYAADQGPRELFGKLRESKNAGVTTTAYVTLEPCCHYGKTPPCASSLVLAGMDRVVVGCRDPNPRVNGGGVQILLDADVTVDVLPTVSDNPDDNDPNDVNSKKTQQACESLVTNFFKRITPRDTNNYEYMTGGMRSTLRSLAGRRKADKILAEVAIGTISNGDLSPQWMEALDDLLWSQELVLLRLNNAVKKKKEAKQLGEKIAQALSAHVAQTVGHTALLYRPGFPPVLDLEEVSQIRQEQIKIKQEERTKRLTSFDSFGD